MKIICETQFNQRSKQATKKAVPNGTVCDAGWQIKKLQSAFLRLPVAPSKLYGGEVAVGVVGVGFGHSCLLFLTEAAATLSCLGVSFNTTI